MKNIMTICTGLLLMSGLANAQTVTTETTTTTTTTTTKDAPHSFKSLHGHEVLPQKGDWALGISATGFLDYLGNMMNNNSMNTTPGFNNANTPDVFAIGSLGGMALSGKYMHSATLAYRIRFQANAGTTTLTNNVLANTITPDPLNPKFTEDKLTTNASVFLLSAGFEKRRGNGRLQGFMGAEAMVGASGSKRMYDYGNQFSSEFVSPLSTVSFGGGGGAFNQTVRTKEYFSGTSLLFGVRGFAGVEYFFAPKISLGGEVGYSVGVATRGQGYTTTEQWYPGTNVTASVTSKNNSTPGLMSLGVGLDNVNAGINLHFYF